jgi:hypothetical protein
MSQCKVLIAFTFALLSQSTLYLRSCAERLRDTYAKFQWLIPPCLSAFEHREIIALVDWITGVQWVAPRCYRMASGVF